MGWRKVSTFSPGSFGSWSTPSSSSNHCRAPQDKLVTTSVGQCSWLLLLGSNASSMPGLLSWPKANWLGVAKVHSIKLILIPFKRRWLNPNHAAGILPGLCCLTRDAKELPGSLRVSPSQTHTWDGSDNYTELLHSCARKPLMLLSSCAQEQPQR